MKILVTGAAGFLGMAVSRALLARGDEVVGIDNLSPYYPVELKRRRLAELEPHPAFRFELLDFADHEASTAALRNREFQRIVHLGAQAGVRYSIDEPRAYVHSNLVGHLNMLELARARRVEHMVYASSSSVYGASARPPFSVEDRADHPVSLYAATKRADELMSESYAHLYRLSLTGLRFFTVYGPWGRPDMAMWLFTDAILSDRPIRMFNGGEIFRDYTFVDDIVRGILLTLDRPPIDDGERKAGGGTSPHALYNIGNNKPERLTRLIDVLENACGRPAIREPHPMQPGDVPYTCADLEALHRDTGFAPSTSIDAGVPLWVEWYRQYRGLTSS